MPSDNESPNMQARCGKCRCVTPRHCTGAYPAHPPLPPPDNLKISKGLTRGVPEAWLTQFELPKRPALPRKRNQATEGCTPRLPQQGNISRVARRRDCETRMSDIPLSMRWIVPSLSLASEGLAMAASKSAMHTERFSVFSFPAGNAGIFATYATNQLEHAQSVLRCVTAATPMAQVLPPCLVRCLAVCGQVNGHTKANGYGEPAEST